MKFKFKAKDIKTGLWVEGDLAYAQSRFGSDKVKTIIVKHYVHGGVIWIGERHFVDESTIELIQHE